MMKFWFHLLLATAGTISIANGVEQPPDPAFALLSTDPARLYLFYPGSDGDSNFFYIPIDRTISASNITSLTTSLPPPPKPDLDGPNCRITQYPYLSENNRLQVLTTTCCSSRPVSLHRLQSRWANSRRVYEWAEVPLKSREYGGLSAAGMFLSPYRSTLYSFGGCCKNSTGGWGFSKELLTIKPASAYGEVYASSGNPPTWPIPQAGFSVTPLTRGEKIIIIGGVTDAVHIGMQQVAVLDLQSMKWSFFLVKTPSGILPRAGHTAMLTHGGSKILVYGGYNQNLWTPATPRMLSLDLEAEELEWRIVYDGGVGPDYGHAAVMMDDIMLITGGHSISGMLKSSVYLFNTTSDNWVDSYTPRTVPVSSRKREKTILACCLTIIPAFLTVGSLLFFCLRRHRRGTVLHDKPTKDPVDPLKELELEPVSIPRQRSRRSYTTGSATAVEEGMAVKVVSARAKVVNVESRSVKGTQSQDGLLMPVVEAVEEEQAGDRLGLGGMNEDGCGTKVEKTEIV